MLTGETKMSVGSATINGFDVYSEIAKARQFMGYCPQYDGLIGLKFCIGDDCIYSKCR